MPARPTNETTNYLAFGRQTVDKDTEASTFYFLKHLDGSGFDPDKDIQEVREGGSGQSVGLRYQQSVKIAGQAVAFSRPEVTGREAAGVLGKDTPSVIASGNIVLHRIEPNGTTPYFTFEQRSGDILERVAACKFSQLDIEYSAGDPAKLTAAYVAGGTYSRRDVASALTPSRETVAPHYYPNRASIIIDGTANAKVTKAKLTAKRGLDDGIQTTALTMDDVVELTQDYDIDVTLKYEAASMYDKIHTSNGSVIPFDLSTGALDITIANGSFPFRAVVPLLHWTGAKVNRLDPDGKTVYLDVAGMSYAGATTEVFFDVSTPGSASVAFA